MSDPKKTRFYMGVSVFGVLIMLTTLFLNPLVFSLLGFLSDATNYRPANAWILFIAVLGLGTGCLGVGYRRFMGCRPEPTDRKKKLLIWLGIPLIAVLIVELTLRVRPIPTTTQTFDMSVPYVPSPVARFMLPNTEIDVTDEDGGVAYRLRSGYHGRAFQKTKPAGQVRLVFLGGSFVFGDHGPNREHPSRNWIGNIEGKLHETGHQHVRIINAGVPGHSSFDSLGRYLAEIHLFEPDYVFVCHAWNDMKYFRDYNRYSPLRLTATLQSPSHQYPKGLDWLLERTQLWLRIKQYMPDIPFTTNTNSHFQGNAQGDSYRDGPWLGDEEALDGFSKLGVRQFELNLRMIVALALETGAQPILLTQPRLVRRDNSAEERERIVYDHQGLTHDTLCSAYEATDQIVAKIGRASGVGYFDFASAVRGDPRFFVDHVHLSIEGNAELSTILSDYIASELLKR